MSSSEDDYSWPKVFTPAEAADAVTVSIDRFREPLRHAASHTDAFEQPRQRAELVAQIDLLNRLDEAARQALGAPSRVGPPRPELAPDPEGPDASQKLPWAGPVPHTNRVAKNSSARHSRLGGDPWAA